MCKNDQKQSSQMGLETRNNRLSELLTDCKESALNIAKNLQSKDPEAQKQLMETVKQLHYEIEALELLVAENRNAQSLLIESNQSSQQFSRRMLEIVEKERQATSKQLHDIIGAGLSAIKFMIEVKQAQIDKADIRQDVSLKTVIFHLMNMIKQSKCIASRLRPPTLDDLGLLATLAAYCRKFEALHQGVDIMCRVDVAEEQIPEGYKIVLYRILQEAMVNAAKHGKPTYIRSIIDIDRDHLRLIVQDDGAASGGFDCGDELQLMRERAKACSGTFNIDSLSGSGTEIKVRLPLSHVKPDIQVLESTSPCSIA